MFSDQLKSNNRKITETFLSTENLKTHLDNPWVKEEVSKEIKNV